MVKHSRHFLEKEKLVDLTKKYPLTDSLQILSQIPNAKFDEAVEFTVKLGINTKHSDQQVRGTLILPHGVGKKTRICVVAKDAKLAEAEAAGADFIGGDELVEKIKSGWVDFDVLITTPDMMKSVGTLGKVLGKRGLMPSPKTGTITIDIKKAVEDFQKGKAEYRADKYGIVHMSVGRKSFSADQLKENIVAVYDALQKAKPSTSKGVYVRGVYLSCTMGPGIEMDAMAMN